MTTGGHAALRTASRPVGHARASFPNVLRSGIHRQGAEGMDCNGRCQNGLHHPGHPSGERFYESFNSSSGLKYSTETSSARSRRRRSSSVGWRRHSSPNYQPPGPETTMWVAGISGWTEKKSRSAHRFQRAEPSPGATFSNGSTLPAICLDRDAGRP